MQLCWIMSLFDASLILDSAHCLSLGRKWWMVGNLVCVDVSELWKLVAWLMALRTMLWPGIIGNKYFAYELHTCWLFTCSYKSLSLSPDMCGSVSRMIYHFDRMLLIDINKEILQPAFYSFISQLNTIFWWCRVYVSRIILLFFPSQVEHKAIL